MTDSTRLQIWSVLSEAFRTILDAVQVRVPAARMTTGHGQNQAFLFRSYADFTAGEQEVVISFDIQVKDSKTHLFGCINSETGDMFAELFDSWLDGALCTEEVLVRQVEEFTSICRGNADLI